MNVKLARIINMTKSKTPDVKLYIDGIEVPVHSVTVNQSAYRTSQATIKIPSHREIQDLGPRALVHIFYNQAGATGASEKNSFADARKHYKLLFEGEITMVGYSKSTSSRYVNLKAVSMNNYLRTATVEQSGFHQALGMNSSVVRNFAFGGKKTDVNIKSAQTDLTADMINIFKDASSVSEGVRLMIQHAFSFDPFLKISNSRLKLSTRVPEIEEEVDFKSWLDQNLNKKLLEGAAGRVNGSQPVMKLVKNILSIFNYNLNNRPDSFQCFVPQPKLNFASPPSCNIITGEMLNNISFNHNYLQEATRFILLTGGMSNIGNNLRLWPPEVQNDLHRMKSGQRADDIEDLDISKRLTDEEMIKGIVPASTTYNTLQVPTGSEVDNTDINRYYFNIARREYQKQRRNAGSASVRGVFNPEVVPGYTTYVVDPEFDVLFGFLSKVRHKISNQNESASTRYTIEYPQRLLNNPRKLEPPHISPFYQGAFSELDPEEDKGNIYLEKEPDIHEDEPKQNLEKFYNEAINADFNENLPTEYDIETINRREDGTNYLDEYFKNFNDTQKQNPVISKGIIAMAQYIKDEGQMSDPHFNKRGHLSPNDVFGVYYNARTSKNSNSLAKFDEYDDWELYPDTEDSTSQEDQAYTLSPDENLNSLLRERRNTVLKYRKRLNKMDGSFAEEPVYVSEMFKPEEENEDA